MILKAMSFNLNAKLEASGIYLPLTTADMAVLTAAVPEGEQIYLTLAWDMAKEYVLATNNKGTIILTRGVDSNARAFPKGSCLYFENSIPVTKWLICNYECCSGDCPVTPVASAGNVLPVGKVGDPWSGSFVFRGDLPMVFGVTGMPSWMKASYKGNYMTLSGTPTASGTFTISVAASNNRGDSIAVASGTLTVTAS